MAAAKFSNSLVQQILGLKDQQKTPDEIAQILNVKKLQVSAILAHRLMNTPRTPDASSMEEARGPLSSTCVQVDDSSASVSTQIESLHPAETASIGEDTEGSGGDFEGGGLSRVFVGDDLEYGDPIYWEPLDSQAVQNPHLMIMGESGSGKTY